MAFYASILAGGSGTRLWPLSTKTTPKQFLALDGNRTMLQATVDRLAPLAPITHTFVVTFDDYVPLVKEQLPELAQEHIIAEPAGRGTAASIGLAATFIAAQDPHAVMGSFSADHLIADPASFQRALRFAERLARDGHLVTLGIRPESPETGFGYIQAGTELTRDSEDNRSIAYRVQRFIEKPDRATAEKFVRQSDYAWNAGIFIWRVDRILAEIHRYVPTVGRVLDEVARGLAAGRGTAAMQEAWTQLTENITIDVGVMEHAADIVVIPVDIGWNDIGNWGQIASLHPGDAAGNGQRLLENGRHILVDTRDTFVYSTTGRIIATTGLEGFVIVDTPEALLICHKSQVQNVKKLVEQLTVIADS